MLRESRVPRLSYRNRKVSAVLSYVECATLVQENGGSLAIEQVIIDIVGIVLRAS